MAESAIFWSVVMASSSQGSAACAASSAACRDDRGDLGLALAAAKTKGEHPERLAALLRFGMDGGLSETFTCHVLDAGRPILKPLTALDSRLLESQCKAQFDAAARANRALFKGVNVSAVCTPALDIRRKANDLVAALKSGEKCSEEDF